MELFESPGDHIFLRIAFDSLWRGKRIQSSGAKLCIIDRLSHLHSAARQSESREQRERRGPLGRSQRRIGRGSERGSLLHAVSSPSTLSAATNPDNAPFSYMMLQHRSIQHRKMAPASTPSPCSLLHAVSSPSTLSAATNPDNAPFSYMMLQHRSIQHRKMAPASTPSPYS
ncbi:hypothetical protein MRX96_047035 [Rhipicephalus microplus]